MTRDERLRHLRAWRELPEHLRLPDGTCRCGAIPATPMQVVVHVAGLRVDALSCGCGAEREPGRRACRACLVAEALAASCVGCGSPVPTHRWRMCDACAARGARVLRRWAA